MGGLSYVLAGSGYRLNRDQTGSVSVLDHLWVGLHVSRLAVGRAGLPVTRLVVAGHTRDIAGSGWACTG
jgi:hypothetical protein